MASLKWAPLPDGRPWWPCIVVDRDTLDARRHAEIIQFYNDTREKRGADDLNKDVLVLLCGLSKQDGGHRFAVVPKTSLRSFQLYANAFSDGIISSGVNAGKPCNSEERKQLRTVIASLGDLSKRTNGAPPPPPPPPPVPASSSIAISTTTPATTTKGSRAAKAILDENKELVKLRKELQGVRRKMNSRSTSRPQSASPPTYDRAFSPVANVPQLDAAAGAAVQNKYPSAQTIAEYYPEMTSQIIRMWDFCHSFSHELSLSQPGTQTAFASITSFEAAIAEPDCALFAQVASSLVNYISMSKGSELVDQWNFSEDKLSAKLGSRCTPLTWECLWDTLVEREIVSKPADPNSKRDILDSLVQACCQLYSTKHVFGLRQSELASELSNAIEFQNNLPALQTQTELRSSVSPDVVQLRVLTGDVFQCKDFFTVERMIDACRADHEVVEPETGRVIARTPELCAALAWEEKLFAGVLSMIKRTQLAKRTRSLSFGKDPYGRSLFSFIGDDEEDDCRVWARDDATDRWYLYRGDFNLARLAELVQDPAARQMIVAILYSSKQRYRPASVAEHREAKLNGWRFGGNELLGRRVLHYTPEVGVVPGVIASWRSLGPTQSRYRVVFTRQVWEHGMDMTDEEVIHLLACSDRPLGDFPLLAPNFTLPPHPFHVPWMPLATTESGFVLIPGHQKKLIGLGVIVARTAPLAEGECDVLVLQDGGEFVTIFGKKQLTEAITLANAFAMRPVTVFVDNIPVPRYPRIDRFRPLTHHCGPLVGLQGVIKLWGKIAVDSVTDLRAPMLTSEQAFVIRAPALWPNPQAGEVWRKFVEGATQVKEFALALECLLFYAEKAVEKGYFTPPPPPDSGGEGPAQDIAIASSSSLASSSAGSLQKEEVRSVASPFKRQRQVGAAAVVGEEEELDEDMGALEEEMKSAERAIAAIESIQSSHSFTTGDSIGGKEQEDSTRSVEQDAKTNNAASQLQITSKETEVKTEQDKSIAGDNAPPKVGTALDDASIDTSSGSTQLDAKHLVLPPPEASMVPSTTTTSTTSAFEDVANNAKASTPRKTSTSSSAVAERRSPRIAASPRRPVYSPKERASPREPRSTPRRVLPFSSTTTTNSTVGVTGDASMTSSSSSSHAGIVNDEHHATLDEAVPPMVSALSKADEMPIISLSSEEAPPTMAIESGVLTSSAYNQSEVDVPVASSTSSDAAAIVKREPVESDLLRVPSTTTTTTAELEHEQIVETQQQSLIDEEAPNNDLKAGSEHVNGGEAMDVTLPPPSSIEVSNEQQDSDPSSSSDACVVVDGDKQEAITNPIESSVEMSHSQEPEPSNVKPSSGERVVDEDRMDVAESESSAAPETERMTQSEQPLLPTQHDDGEHSNKAAKTEMETTGSSSAAGAVAADDLENQPVASDQNASSTTTEVNETTSEVAHQPSPQVEKVQAMDVEQQSPEQREGVDALPKKESDSSTVDQKGETSEL